MFNCCSHGTLLHFSLQSSRLNICYYHQDLHPRPLQPGSRPSLPPHPRHLPTPPPPPPPPPTPAPRGRPGGPRPLAFHAPAATCLLVAAWVAARRPHCGDGPV